MIFQEHDGLGPWDNSRIDFFCNRNHFLENNYIYIYIYEYNSNELKLKLKSISVPDFIELWGCTKQETLKIEVF